MSIEKQDPAEDVMLEPVAEETQYKIMARLLDKELLPLTSYIKDDRDVKKIMMIKTQLEAYEETMKPLAVLDDSVREEVEQIKKMYMDHVLAYLETMVIRKGWRPEQIAAILSAHERIKKKSMLFEDEQMKGVNEIKSLKI